MAVRRTVPFFRPVFLEAGLTTCLFTIVCRRVSNVGVLCPYGGTRASTGAALPSRPCLCSHSLMPLAHRCVRRRWRDEQPRGAQPCPSRPTRRRLGLGFVPNLVPGFVPQRPTWRPTSRLLPPDLGPEFAPNFQATPVVSVINTTGQRKAGNDHMPALEILLHSRAHSIEKIGHCHSSREQAGTSLPTTAVMML